MNAKWKQECLEEVKEVLIHHAVKASFLATFMRSQILHSAAPGARQRFYTDWELIFWLGFRHRAGRQGIRYLTGAGNYNKKENNNSNTNFNLHIPSNRLLDMYEEPGYYGIPNVAKVAELQQRASNYATHNKCPWFIISFDGVFALPGYEYDYHQKLVLGGEKAYTATEFMQMTDEQHVLNIGREIVQFHAQSVDGGYVEAIGHFVIPYGKPVAWIVGRLKELVEVYSISKVVEFIGSSSDGDLFTFDSQVTMDIWSRKKFGLFWTHFWDFSHAVRNTRGAFLRRKLLLPGYDTAINALKLLQLKVNNPVLTDIILPIIAINPTDEMSMHDCMLLFNSKLITTLETIEVTKQGTEDGKVAGACAKFFKLMQRY